MIETDTVIFAVGQFPEIPEGFGLDLGGRGLIEPIGFQPLDQPGGSIRRRRRCSRTASVIHWLGRKAAVAVDKYLGGSGRIDRRLAPQEEAERSLGRQEGFAALARAADPCVIPEELASNFCEVVKSMEEGAAHEESARCLQCDLRLKIQQVKFWGSY